MPLEFPANPSQDQQYADYRYNVPDTAWLSDAEKSGFEQRISAKEGIVPPGTIHLYAGTTAPAGFLLCQGQTPPRNTYPALFAAIGTTYGAGDGSTTFGIPDLQGRVAAGKSTSGTFATLNNRGGAETHTLTVSEMPSHTHIQDSHNHTQNSHNHTQNAHNHSFRGGQVRPSNPGGFTVVGVRGGSFFGYGISYTEPTQFATATNNPTTATNNPTTATNQDAGGLSGVTQSHNNLQPYIVLNYIIKT